MPFLHTENQRKKIDTFMERLDQGHFHSTSQFRRRYIMLKENPRGEQKSRLYRTNLCFLHTFSHRQYTVTLQTRSDLCIPRNETARPRSQFPHSCKCARFIYSHDRSTFFAAAKQAERSSLTDTRM